MNKLREKRNVLYEKAQKIVDGAKNETRAITDEEKTEYQNTVAEIRSLDQQIQAEEELRNLELEKGSSEGNVDSGEKAEIRAFENYIRSAAGGKPETRDTNVNMTYGANGAVIPNTIMNKVIDRVINISPLFAAATKYTVKGNITIPYIDRTGGDITVAFAEEFSELTAKSFKFSSIQLKGYLAACLVLLSKQLINNSQIDVVGYVIDKMAEKIAVFIENFLVNGDTSKNAKSGLKNSVTQILAIESSTKITGDVLIDVQDTIPDEYQRGSFWLMNPKTRTIVRKLKDGQGNYLMIPDFRGNSNYILLGKPVYVTDNLPAATSAGKGDHFLYYGDFTGLAVKVGEQTEVQLLVEKYAEQHALGFNAWFEIDSTVENAQKIVALAIASDS
ncbi:MAG: phage major capsid protein [Clostridia bacterium]|nr:phage major capsid protein [Clostridia bacterium]